jgi:deoxyribose-phosphate aldolase
MTASDHSVRRQQAKRVLALVDLTNLDDACTEADVDRLCERAHGPFGDVAAVCVWPRFVARAVQNLRGTQIAVATVVNFPSGDDDVSDVVALTERCVLDGADDIDVVLPYRSVLVGDVESAGAVLEAVRAAVPSTRHMKVILETGELVASDLITLAARLAIQRGADFIKTSTGKTSVSATPDSARIMLDVIADSIRPIGLKPSGGIRTLDDAVTYLDLADEIMGPTWVSTETFRFGASGLLDALEAELTETSDG